MRQKTGDSKTTRARTLPLTSTPPPHTHTQEIREIEKEGGTEVVAEALEVRAGRGEEREERAHTPLSRRPPAAGGWGKASTGKEKTLSHFSFSPVITPQTKKKLLLLLL